jgi:hypothetical protein
MRDDVNQQYEHMTLPVEKGGMGLRHEVTKHDPYPTASAMAHDVAHGRIQTMATAATGPHAILSNQENDRFRAVHDVFGHAATGRGFSRHGEEAAWRSHVQMFSPEAKEAMTSETRGQNSVVNYSPQLQKFVPQSEAAVPMSKLAQSPQASGMLRSMRAKKQPAQGEQGRLFR